LSRPSQGAANVSSRCTEQALATRASGGQRLRSWAGGASLIASSVLVSSSVAASATGLASGSEVAPSA